MKLLMKLGCLIGGHVWVVTRDLGRPVRYLGAYFDYIRTPVEQTCVFCRKTRRAMRTTREQR